MRRKRWLIALSAVIAILFGAKYLLLDTAAAPGAPYTIDNIKQRRGRPSLVALLGKEDRSAVAAQLHTLATLPKDVHLVIAHDPVAYERDLAAGLFHARFAD